MILLFIAVLSGIVGVLVAVVVWKRRQDEMPREVNYQAFFLMGLVFVSVGVVFMTTMNPGFIGIMGLGIVYMILGVANRDKWPATKNKL